VEAATVLTTERLLLRLPRLDDAVAFGELLADAEVMRFIGGETVPPEEYEGIVGSWLERWRQNDMGPFAIERRADGRVLGRAGIVVWDTRVWAQSTFAEAEAAAQVELGWALARSAWGNGYATEAARAVERWVRVERGVGSLVSVIAPENDASQRVAARLGAEPAETVRLAPSGVDAVVWRYP
jgi:RimJ/RimL family protein N-acetyltransferase